MKKAIFSLLLLLSVFMAGCSQPPPDNVVELENGDWIPSDGYAWVDVNNPSQGVSWVPGLESRDFANVLASSAEGQWVPRVGYWWVDDSRESSMGQVFWDKGRLHPTFANIITSSRENSWIPLPGYRWSVANTLSNGVWQSGLRHGQFRNVFSAPAEGTWTVPPGYQFETTGQLSNAVWQPGTQHPKCPNVFASDAEGSWKPASGYTFANSDQSDLSVVLAGQTDFEKFMSVAVPFVVAAIAYDASQPQVGDGVVGSAGRLAANVVAEASVDAATSNLATLFPSKC